MSDSKRPIPKPNKALAIILVMFLLLTWHSQVLTPHLDKQRESLSSASNHTEVSNGGKTGSAQVGNSLDETSARSISQNALLNAAGSSPALQASAQQVSPAVDISSAPSLVVDTPQFEAEISLLGARLLHLKLKDHKKSVDKNSAALDLVRALPNTPYPLGVYSGFSTINNVRSPISDAASLYSVKNSCRGSAQLNVKIGEGEPCKISLQAQLSDGRSIEKAFYFNQQEGPFIDFEVSLSAAPQDFSPLTVEWTSFVEMGEVSMTDRYAAWSFVWFDGKKANRKNIEAKNSNPVVGNDITWASLGDKYFTATFVSENTSSTSAYMLSDNNFAAIQLKSGDVKAKYRIYLGPKAYYEMQTMGYELQRTVDFGFLGFLGAPLLWLLHALNTLVNNYGVSIVLLTILVKLVLYPLNTVHFTQMKKMQDIAPELKKLRETIEDPQQQRVAMMEMYSKRGVNPLGGCLPMLLQMPIFFGLYCALQIDVGLRHAPFALWIQDLSARESFEVAGMSIPVLVLLLVLSMLIQQWITPSTADPKQKKIMMIIPFVFGFFFAAFPAGLTLYWFTNNIVSIAQMQGLHRGVTARGTLKLTLAACALVFVLALLLAKLS